MTLTASVKPFGTYLHVRRYPRRQGSVVSIMTKKPKKPLEAYELTGKKLETYRIGFRDGNQGNYFPGGLDEATYDWGHGDGQKYGDRKGKPWTLAELINLCPPMGGRRKKGAHRNG